MHGTGWFAGPAVWRYGISKAHGVWAKDTLQ